MSWLEILKVGCEGGSLTLFGREQEKGGWQFQFTTDETTLKDFLSDEDAKVMDFTSASATVYDWDNVILLLDVRYPDWKNMYPLGCHPQFHEKVWHVLNKRRHVASSIRHIEEWNKILTEKSVVNSKYRTEDFKFGCFHGKSDAENIDSEAHIQRLVFKSMRIKLVCSNANKIDIRVIGYEIPLTKNSSRGKCIDLLGYDIDHNLYLIELKKGISTEKVPKILEQIYDYKNILYDIIPFIEDEFYKTFYFTLTTNKIIPILLAPKEFYLCRSKDLPEESEILFCYFREQEIKSFDPSRPVSIHKFKEHKK